MPTAFQLALEAFADVYGDTDMRKLGFPIIERNENFLLIEDIESGMIFKLAYCTQAGFRN